MRSTRFAVFALPSDSVVTNPGSASTLGEVVLKVEVPSNHGYPLDEALTRLHAFGLRASFPGARTPCGELLPWVDVQSPRAPAPVPTGTIVSLKFGHTPIPSPTVPLHHAPWTTVPALVGRDFAEAAAQLTSIWPCVHVRGATATSVSRLVVVAQDPKPGTRVRAYGARVGQGYRPTTVDVTVAIR